MKLLVLVNPRASGGRTLRMLPKVRDWFTSTPHSLTFRIPGSKEETLLHARNAVHEGYEGVIAFGGDGTVVDVIEGMHGTGIPTGVLPGGRGNDFARNLGSPTDLQACIEGFADPHERVIDMPMVNGRPFVNVAGVGFDAKVVRLVAEGRCKLTGTVCYFYNVLKGLFTFKPVPMTIEADDRRFEGRYTMIAVANGKHYGGGMCIAPDAELDDRLLDLVLINAVHPLTLLRYFPKVYKGSHVKLKIVTYFKAKRLHIRSSQPLDVAVDGDLRGTTPALFEVGTRRVHILAPKGAEA